MSNHTSQKAINLHHTQQENAKIRKLKREYQREHEREMRRREMRKLGIAWEIFKAVYIACVITALMSAGMWAIKVIYGI